MRRPRLEIPLDTDEKLQTAVATLRLCVVMAYDLAEEPVAREINGCTALQALAGVLEEMIGQVLDDEAG